MSQSTSNEIRSVQIRGYASGVLPFFDNGKTVLLGKEYRKTCNESVWMEFGGKPELSETPAETACREANEETAWSLNLRLDQVEEAEKNGHYVDYLNPGTGTFYRMYCVFLDEKIDLSVFHENKKRNSEHVEKDDWGYFSTEDVIYGESLPIPDGKIYSTSRTRYNMLKEKQFFKDLNL